MMQPQAKDAKDASKAPAAGRGKKGFPYRFPRACGPGNSLILDFQTCEKINFCCSKLPSLWNFVTAAPGD